MLTIECIPLPLVIHFSETVFVTFKKLFVTRVQTNGTKLMNEVSARVSREKKARQKGCSLGICNRERRILGHRLELSDDVFSRTHNNV